MGVTQYVEKAVANGLSQDAQTPDAHYYVVLEAEHGSVVLTELLADGSVTWEENRSSLGTRNSLARVIRTAQGQEGGAIVQEMKNYRAKAQDNFSVGALRTCRDYATGAYIAAVGGPQEAFHRRPQTEVYRMKIDRVFTKTVVVTIMTSLA